MAANNLNFAFTVAPVGEAGMTDEQLYGEVLADCKLGQSLGYDSAWMLEHHFSDYFPTPSPLLFMANLAPQCPGLGFGAAVLVTPWYHPVRLAGEIAMLSNLCTGNLYLGLGRGTAKLEYDAFDMDMEEARDRFKDCYEILKRGLAGETFSYEGKHYSTNREICIRPTPKSDRIHLYGALGSPQSATIMAEMGLAPLNTCQFPFHILEKAMEAWNGQAAASGYPDDPRRPVMAHTLMADSDDEAMDLARRHLSEFFALQVAHYEADADVWVDIKGYEQFSRFFQNLSKLADPDNIDDFAGHNFVGSTKKVCEQVETLAAIGFNHMIVQPATVGVPRALRHDVLRRFAETVAPEFSSAFSKAA